MSKIRALLKAFYTVRYTDDAQIWLYIREVPYTIALNYGKVMIHRYKEGVVMLNKSGGKRKLRNQGFAFSHMALIIRNAR